MTARENLARHLGEADKEFRELEECQQVNGDYFGFLADAAVTAGWRPPAARGDHEIVWHLDGDHVRGEAVCHLEPGADCRVTCPKGCEEIEGFSRDDDGRPFHTVWDEASDD